MWALASSIAALLGRDNSKIPPARTERLLKGLQEFVLLINAMEAEGIEFSQVMKNKFVARFTREALTRKPPVHPKEILTLHSQLVDLFIQDKGWPIKKVDEIAKYKHALIENLPEIFEQLSKHHGCSPRCPANSPTEIEIKKNFWLIRSPSRLRDTIVGFYHGNKPESVRGPRVKHRIRRRTSLQ